MRPFSAIRFIYPDKPLTAWGGPGQGVVNDITAREWRPYLQMANHPEYPSAQPYVARTQPPPPCSSVPTNSAGRSGARGIVGGRSCHHAVERHHAHLRHLGRVLGRLWHQSPVGGWHFLDSIPAGQTIGERVYEWVVAHIEDNQAKIDAFDR